MSIQALQQLAAQIETWQPPVLPENIPHGDMPGDKIEIGAVHIEKANTVFRLLVPMLAELNRKTVVTVCGGSGVGKSETASILSYYLREAGIGAYTLSGDNYPRRIPMYNDAERVRVFRVGGLRGMLAEGVYSDEAGETLRRMWAEETDAAPQTGAEDPAIAVYQKYGREALAGYLGTEQEQDYGELSAILAAFRSGAEELWLKRMGRTEDERWYNCVDMRDVDVLILEWTHGNSDYLNGVDIPVLLNSTPEETRAHRRSRNRDGKVDSPFTTMVLEIEQKELDNCAHKARIIMAKSGEVLSYAQYRSIMDTQGG